VSTTPLVRELLAKKILVRVDPSPIGRRHSTSAFKFPESGQRVPLLTELKRPDCEPPSPSNSVEVRRRGGCGRALRQLLQFVCAAPPAIFYPVREGCPFAPVPEKRSLLPNRGVAPRATDHRRRFARQETLHTAITGRRRSQRFPPMRPSSEGPPPGLLREPAPGS
jgi:hypothetical protein